MSRCFAKSSYAKHRSVLGLGLRERSIGDRHEKGASMVDNGTKSTAESLVRTAWESYRSVLGSFAMVQEQNMKLARYSTGVFLEGAEK